MVRARRAGVGLVAWGHGYSKRENGVRKRLRRLIGTRADALLFYNHTARQKHLDEGDDPERCFVALNSLDQSPIESAKARVRATPGEPERFASGHDLEPSQTLLYVSRIQPANRVDMLVRAVANLRVRFPRLAAVIIGKGDGVGELRALAAELGVAERVRFLGAVYDEDELARWFLSSRVFCYPANIGLSVLHAFGYGTPVVTSDRLESQNPEIEALEHDGNGLLYADGSQKALEDALSRLLSDDDLHRRLAAKAERTVSERFTVRNMVDGMIEAAQYAAARAARRRK